jgi:hypothetical protein
VIAAYEQLMNWEYKRGDLCFGQYRVVSNTPKHLAKHHNRGFAVQKGSDFLFYGTFDDCKNYIIESYGNRG